MDFCENSEDYEKSEIVSAMLPRIFPSGKRGREMAIAEIDELRKSHDAKITIFTLEQIRPMEFVEFDYD